MSNLVPSPGSFGLTRAERQAAKEVARARVASSVVAAREAAKIDAIAEVGETALVSAAVLTDLECLLVSRNPAFAGRAAYINGGNCMAMAVVVNKMARRL